MIRQFFCFLCFIVAATLQTAADNDDYLAEQRVAAEWLAAHGLSGLSESVDFQVAPLEDVIVFTARRQRAFVVVLRQALWAFAESPVMAYSTDSYININGKPIQHFLEQLHLQLTARQQGAPASLPLPYLPKNEAIAPLLGDLAWGQYSPYNVLAPTMLQSQKKAIIGCVPLAIAMVMSYHKWPHQGESHVYYQPDNTTYSMDYTKCKPQWDEYRSTYTSHDTLEARNLSHLLVSIAMAVDATFSENATSAQMSQVKHTMCNNFRYSGKLALRRDSLTTPVCLALLYRDLDARRPVLVTDNGHAFVCDGYEGSFLHFNFGWHGNSNGFYRMSLGNSVTNVTDTLTWLTTIIYGIQPEQPLRREVTVRKAGTLSEALSTEEKESVTELIVKGPVNSTDICLLRKMSGAPDFNAFTSWQGGSLRHLDLSDATIVNDKHPYRTEKATGSWWYVDGDTGRRTTWDFAKMTKNKWLSFKRTMGTDHEGMFYSYTDDDRYWSNYYCQKNIVGSRMFANCSSLHDINLPKGTREVGNYAFAGCSSLQEIRLPEKVEKVGRMPFSHCTALEKILIPNTAEMDKQGTAEDCSPVMKSVTIYLVRK